MPDLPKDFDDFKEKLPISMERTNFERDRRLNKFVLFNDYVGNSTDGNDDHGNKEYAVTFVSQAGLEGLVHFSTWVMDGTFDIVLPNSMFEEILVIVGVDDELRSYPLVWSFLSHKTSTCYEIGVFKPLRESIVDQLHPKVCVADNDKAIGNAIKEVFPTFDVYGCAYQWDLAINREVGNIGLASTQLSEFPELRELMNEFKAMQKALSYVCPNCVPHYFNALAMYVQNKMSNNIAWNSYSVKVVFFLAKCFVN